MKNEKIGVIGAGFVGNAVIQNIKDDVDILVFDIDKNKSTLTLNYVVEQCKYIFCCLPTIMLEDGTQDFSQYESFFQYLSTQKVDDKIFIIKSTVLHENIKEYFIKYKIVMNPEFLNANSSVEDFRNQKEIILGGNPIDIKNVKNIYSNYFNLDESIEYIHMSHEEAINIKYVHNIYHAYKILFWNFIHETTGNARLYSSIYKKIREGMDNEMSQISPDGKMGYGGACFPKDVTSWYKEKGHELLEFMCDYNNKLRK